MINAIFAVDDVGGLGNEGDMPWPFNKEDMVWFKNTTENHVVVMGKKSWQSPNMPKPLPKRTNVIFTNNFEDRNDIIQIKGDVCEGLIKVKNDFDSKQIFVIGGANILEQSLPVLNKIYLTRIPGSYETDVKINLDIFLKNFKIVETKEFNLCKVEIYERISHST